MSNSPEPIPKNFPKITEISVELLKQTPLK
jgi:hypothetical protein